LPPLVDGGVAGLWARDHQYVQDTYGPFELLNFVNTPHRIKRGTMTDKTWQLVAMGNFLPGNDLQFATLAQLKERVGGTLVIMFEWKDPADSAAGHGVFYHTFLRRSDLLIRTKQGAGGLMDTLEISCADLQRACGKCYYDSTASSVVLRMADK
jgi:hypothetical protein